MVKKVKEPLVLKQGELEYKLKFNGKPYEMEIWVKNAEFEIEVDHFH
jgi:putative protease